MFWEVFFANAVTRAVALGFALWVAGGVLADGEIYTFAKVRAGEEAMWYLVPELVFVKEGDRVLVPEGHLTREGVVEKLERCTRQTAPVPMSRVKEIAGLAQNG